VGTNHITKISHKVIRPTQKASISRQHFLEWVTVLHESIHELLSKKLDGIILKFYFQRACEKKKMMFLATNIADE
jgi:hypothetical protein